MNGVLLSAVIAAYVVFAWTWTAPAPSRSRSFAKRFKRPVVALGLWHNWNMFLPNPPTANSTISVRLWLDDGSVVFWSPRALETAAIGRSFLDVRHRKFYSNLLRGPNAWFRHPFLESVVRLVETGDRRVVRCDLLHHFEPIQDVHVAGHESPTEQRYLVATAEF